MAWQVSNVADLPNAQLSVLLQREDRARRALLESGMRRSSLPPALEYDQHPLLPLSELHYLISNVWSLAFVVAININFRRLLPQLFSV